MTTENLDPVGWPEALPPSVPAASGFKRLGEAWRLVKRNDPSEPCKCGEEVWTVQSFNKTLTYWGSEAIRAIN